MDGFMLVPKRNTPYADFRFPESAGRMSSAVFKQGEAKGRARLKNELFNRVKPHNRFSIRDCFSRSVPVAACFPQKAVVLTMA